MTRWYGKLLGVVIGVALLRSRPLLGAVLGLLVGHAFDRGWFGLGSSGRRTGPASSRQEHDDPYAVLGVAPNASDAEIEQAYRRLISRHHPDRAGGVEARAREINRAYDRIRALRKSK